MAHPNAELLQHGYDALAAGDTPAVLAILQYGHQLARARPQSGVR